jgi:PhzF family phenazine biosynthesis protein
MVGGWEDRTVPSRRFSQVDVFTSTPYAGNPVAVVHDAEGLDDAAMQRFARWTNLSETTFLLPPDDERADYRVRIFTPTRELPFAGHPTLGTCHAWLDAAGAGHRAVDVVQECGIGLVTVRRTDDGLAFAAPPLRRSGPLSDEELEHVLGLLNLDRSAVVEACWLVNGPEWIGVLLKSAEAVLAVRPGVVDGDIGVVGPHPDGSAESFEVRAFFPVAGATIEDPVTGSLNAAIASWLVGCGRVSAPYVARQGTAIGRAGRVHITQTEDGTLWTGGGTVTCVSGTVEL